MTTNGSWCAGVVAYGTVCKGVVPRKWAQRPREFGWHVRRGTVDLARLVPATRGRASVAAQKGVFRKEGEYWTVGYGGKAFRLKDTKGLGYLAHLLRHPAAEFHVLDLVGGIASQREEDETSQSVQGLPRGDEDLEKAGIHIAQSGRRGRDARRAGQGRL